MYVLPWTPALRNAFTTPPGQLKSLVYYPDIDPPKYQTLLYDPAKDNSRMMLLNSTGTGRSGLPDAYEMTVSNGRAATPVSMTAGGGANQQRAAKGTVGNKAAKPGGPNGAKPSTGEWLLSMAKDVGKEIIQSPTNALEGLWAPIQNMAAGIIGKTGGSLVGTYYGNIKQSPNWGTKARQAKEAISQELSFTPRYQTGRLLANVIQAPFNLLAKPTQWAGDYARTKGNPNLGYALDELSEDAMMAFGPKATSRATTAIRTKAGPAKSGILEKPSKTGLGPKAGEGTAEQAAEGAPGTAIPVGNGPFGPIFDTFRGKTQAAIAHLRELKTGEAPGALDHPAVGEIDLVWGNEGTAAKNYGDGYGLAKIIKKHPEVVDDLQDIIRSTKGRSKEGNRLVLESSDHRAVVALKWDAAEKKWLLTAYEKE